MDNTLDPQILDELNKLPSWARQEAIRRLRGEDTRTASDKLLGDAFKGVGKAADVLNKAPIVGAPAGNLNYLANLLRGQNPTQASSGQGIRAEDPKKFVQPQAAKVPVIGKELSGAAGAVLDPATIVGAGLVGPGLLANVGGRGTMGLGAYLGLNAAGGAGAVGASEAAKAVGNPDVGLGIHLATPAALAGGFLGATGASIASARIEGNAAIRNAGEAVVGDGGSLKNRAFNFADEIKQEDPFQIYKVAANAEGKPSYVMDRASLEQRIQGRKAAAGLKNPDGSSKIPGGDIGQWNQDTAHLENLASYMHNTGRQDLTLVDPWATAHSLGSAQESLGQRANWATRASQAQAIVDERSAVIGPEPDLRYTKSQQNAFQMLRGDIPPELDAKLLEGKALRDQVAQSGQSIAQAEQAVKDARQGFKDYTGQIKQTLPKGANTAASKHISALIGGDPQRIAETTDLLSRRGVDVAGSQDTFNQAVALHSAHGQAEATRDALKQSHQALTDSLKSNQQSSEELAKSVFKNANSMKNKLFQTGNSKSLYRLGSKGLVTDEKGQILANLEQVTPSSSVKEAVGSNAALQAEDAAKVSEAQGQLNDLLAQRKAARATGDKTAIEGLRTQINDAKVNIDRLKTPSRPVPKEMLPPSPGRLIVPLKDLANFNVLEPNTFNPAALTKDGIRDGRTVSLLNDHARIKSETDQLSSQIKKTQTDLADLQSKVIPNENEKVLLSQGVIDGVRPEIVQGYQSMARLNEEQQMLSGLLDQKQTEFGAVEDRLSRSQQGLEATLQQAETDRDFANEQLLKHNADYEKHMTDFEASLSLGDPSTIATRNLQNFKDSHQAVMDSITGKLSNKRVTEAAFQTELGNAEKLTQSRYMDLPREFASQHQDWVSRQANALSDMGAQAGFKRLHTPFTTAETNLDPMAMRSGIGGFLRRSLMGTGLPSARMEGWGAEFMNGRVRATTMAKMSYEAAKQNIAEIADLHLGTLANGSDETAAWARTLRSEKDPAQRLQQYMAHAVKPMDDPAWKKALGPAAEHATPEELKALYDQASDSFLMLTAHPGLVDWKKTSLEFGTQARDWGQRVNEVRDLAGGRKIVPSMVKPEFRENLPTGRLQPVLGSGGEAVNIADKDRNWATDMLEIIRNEQYSKKNRGLWRVANQQLSGISNTASIPLQDMLIPKHMWEETMAANTLASINKDAAYSSLANELKDPKQIAKIKQDGDLNANEWKDPEVAQSWGKMKGWLREDTPEGIWKDIEQVRRGAQKVASSLIFGDLGFMGNQALTGMAISPAESSRIIAHAKAGSLTDHGFMMAMQDNYDLIQHLSDKGVNLFGSSGVRGGSSAGNLLEMVPGLRIGGKALGKLDALTFERMQPLMFLDLYKASQAQLQNVRAFGRTPFTESLVDGVPGLASLHSKQDIWQSSSEELDNALLRNLENQMGNIRDSSLLLGANRKKLESTLLFVPGYFRAKAGVYTQAARALRDPSSPEGWLAASLLAREAAFRVGFGATVAAASGQFDGYMKDIGDMTAFDPRNSGGPLAGPLGDGGHLGLSWGNAAPKLYTQMLLGQKSGTANLNPGERLSAVKDFFDGRTNPVIRGMVEQYEGKDFMGRAVKTPGQRAEALAQNVLPIWIGQGLQTGTDQLAKDGKINPLAVAAESGAQFINLNYKDNAPYDVLNNRFVAWQAQKFPGQPTADYRNAPSDLRRMAKEQDPAVAEAERSWNYDRSRRSDPKSLQTDMAFKDFDHFNSQKDQNVAEATARVQAGKMDLATWKEVYSSAQEDRADNADQLRQRLSDLGIDLTKSSNNKSATLGGKAPDVALALAEYRSVKPQDYLKSNPDGTPITRFTDAGPVLDQDIDWTKYQAAKDATLGKYSPAVQEQIKTWLEPDDPIAKQLTHARAAMDTYFSDVPKYQGLSVEQGNYIDMYMSGMRAFAGQLADAGAKVDPQLAYSTALKQMAQQGHIQTPEQVKLAMMAQNMLSNSKLQLQARNPASLQFLLDHQDVLKFYPWMKSELPSKLNPLLDSDLRRTADYNAIASRELRQ